MLWEFLKIAVNISLWLTIYTSIRVNWPIRGILTYFTSFACAHAHHGLSAQPAALHALPHWQRRQKVFTPATFVSDRNRTAGFVCSPVEPRKCRSHLRSRPNQVRAEGLPLKCLSKVAPRLPARTPHTLLAV